MTKTITTMAMPCTVTIVDNIDDSKTNQAIDDVFAYFKKVDIIFSPFRKESAISKINQNKLKIKNAGAEVKNVLKLCNDTKKLSNGYFEIRRNGYLDPSGLVKGWAINKAAKIIRKQGFKNFFVEIAGDIQTSGHPTNQKIWTIGIRNPFEISKIVKVLELSGEGIATSGIYMQGLHVYNPILKKVAKEILSLTVIGPNVYEADRFATAAFAMGYEGINFIENYPGLSGYAIDKKGIATFTSDFLKFVK